VPYVSNRGRRPPVGRTRRALGRTAERAGRERCRRVLNDVAFGILDEPSAEQILPEQQELDAGDTIPLGATEEEGLLVKAIQPERALVTVP
jgi:hypothetical protein